MLRRASALLSGLLALGIWAPANAQARGGGDEAPEADDAYGAGGDDSPADDGPSSATAPTPPGDTAPESASDEVAVDEGEGIDAILIPTRLLLSADEGREALQRRRLALDALLTDASQDLDLVLDLTEAGGAEVSEVSEDELAALAQRQGKLVVLPLLRPLDELGDSFELRIVVASPGTSVLRTRLTQVAADTLAVRAVAMLRDIIVDRPRGAAPAAVRANHDDLAEPVRSRGRAILAINGALYGGFVGYSIQRASKSDDPRLLYPMVAVGAGIGLGATIIVADEWDVGAGDAWYLAAGAWWPAVAGHLVYEGRFGDTPGASGDEAWSFGLISSLTGMTMATVGLLPGGMGDGGAALAHSGGGLGLVVGGLSEFAVTGVSDEVPFSGMGYGVGIGWLLGATAAIHIHPDVAQVLTIDLGTMLGGLVGAAAASPLLFGEPDDNKTRGWVAATGGGLLLGAGFSWWLSSDDEAAPVEPEASSVQRQPDGPVYRVGIPQLALVGSSPPVGELGGPGWGVRWEGQLW